jgi:F0F1-type ATP synthase beta subunit
MSIMTVHKSKEILQKYKQRDIIAILGMEELSDKLSVLEHVVFNVSYLNHSLQSNLQD